jgi:hypothetical protein
VPLRLLLAPVVRPLAPGLTPRASPRPPRVLPSGSGSARIALTFFYAGPALSSLPISERPPPPQPLTSKAQRRGYGHDPVAAPPGGPRLPYIQGSATRIQARWNVPPSVPPLFDRPSVQPASRGFKRPSGTRRHHSSPSTRRPSRSVGARCNVPLRLLLTPGVRRLGPWPYPAGFAPAGTGSRLRERLRTNRPSLFLPRARAVIPAHLGASSTTATPYVQGSATRIRARWNVPPLGLPALFEGPRPSRPLGASNGRAGRDDITPPEAPVAPLAL